MSWRSYEGRILPWPAYHDSQIDRTALSYPVDNPVTIDPRINVITPGVRFFDRSRAFYRRGLGWEGTGAG